MCGIFGAISTSCVKDCLEGLKLLEYRGYDSAGIATKQNDTLHIYKTVGRVQKLVDLCKDTVTGDIAIGHTRWATHGAVTRNNAHPFVSYDGRFALVHNGIIDNYLPLKQHLLAKNIKFSSQTDSEVIAHTLALNANNSDTLSAVATTAKTLQGTFAVAVVDNTDNCVYLMRKGSPLYVGLLNDNAYLSSDVNTLRYYCNSVTVLPDGCYARLTSKSLEVYSLDNGEKINCQQLTVQSKVVDNAKQGDAMLSEIFEIPSALMRTYRYLLDNAKHNNAQQLNSYERIYFVGCGTAYHSCLTGALVAKKFLNIEADAVLASEWLYSYSKVDSNTLVVAVTQSGETADTLSACKYAHDKGATVYAVTNVEGSTVTFVADNVILTQADSEVAVASTKAYVCQVLALIMLVLDMALCRHSITQQQYDSYIADFDIVPSVIQNMLSNTQHSIMQFAQLLADSKAVFFIGRGNDYFTAQEGSLKLKEVSYIFSEAYASGELKHGTLALMEKGVTVVGIACQQQLFDKHLHAVSEVQSRGATVLSITPFEDKVADIVFALPTVAPLYYPIVSVVPLQLFAYHTAILRGCDADKPRNLAKSVTVG